MANCWHCNRRIIGKPRKALTITVDDSVEELPTGDVKVWFCSDRCKRDWFDNLFSIIGADDPSLFE